MSNLQLEKIYSNLQTGKHNLVKKEIYKTQIIKKSKLKYKFKHENDFLKYLLYIIKKLIYIIVKTFKNN
jgi:hypothetical protein